MIRFRVAGPIVKSFGSLRSNHARLEVNSQTRRGLPWTMQKKGTAAASPPTYAISFISSQLRSPNPSTKFEGKPHAVPQEAVQHPWVPAVLYPYP